MLPREIHCAVHSEVVSTLSGPVTVMPVATKLDSKEALALVQPSLKLTEMVGFVTNAAAEAGDDSMAKLQNAKAQAKGAIVLKFIKFFVPEKRDETKKPPNKQKSSHFRVWPQTRYRSCDLHRAFDLRKTELSRYSTHLTKFWPAVGPLVAPQGSQFH
jgi:hypothetical protein